MSTLLNLGPPSQAARSTAAASAAAVLQTALQIVVNEERSEEQREIGDREAEGLLRNRVAVSAVDAQPVTDERRAERCGGDEIDEPAHADGERQERHAEEDQRIEQHLQPRVGLAVGDR